MLLFSQAGVRRRSRLSGSPLTDGSRTLTAALGTALPAHHPVFRQVSHNPQLMPEGITINPAAVALEANGLAIDAAPARDGGSRK